MNNNQVDDFMSKLSKQTSSGHQKARVFNYQTRKLEKLSLNHPDNLGRYQVIPINNVTIGGNFPYISGRVKQINMPRKTTGQDGQESVYNAWIHIPSPGFYQMLDMSGRTVSSLTTEDENLLATASTLWDELYNELDVKNHYAETRGVIRSRNYTLFSGYCLNFWRTGSANNRVPDRQNFSALFMITDRAFLDNVEKNIDDKSLMDGGDKSWLDKVYNSDLSNRDGFILFSVNKAAGPGFVSTVQHEYGRAQMLSGVEIPQEDFDAGMSDAVSLFLGWQASNQDSDKPFGYRRLFNTSLMKETISYMSNLLASVRAAKAMGGNPMEAVEKVNKSFVDTVASSGDTVQVQPQVQETVAMNNTPEPAQIDPISGGGFGVPGNQSQGFASPSAVEPSVDFSNAAPGFDPSDTPF